MRKLYSLLAVLLGSFTAQAQQINNVTWTPNPPNECVSVNFTFHLVLPGSGSVPTFDYAIAGTDITITLNGEGGSGGSAPEPMTIEGFGPYAPATYSLTVVLLYNTNEADTWEGSFTSGVGVAPDPGEFGDRTVCNTAPSFNLFTVLGGTPDPGGMWFDPIGAAVPGGTFVPGTSLEGPYTYHFELLKPCADAEQVAYIAYQPNSDPGTNSTVQICSSAGAPSVDLFTQLGGTPEVGGTWTSPSGGSMPSGIFVPGTNGPGAYRYTMPGIAPCGDPFAVVTVQPVLPAHAGTNGAAQFCFNEAAAVLNDQLTGNEQTTGNWYDPNGFILGPYNVPVNVELIGEGVYTYVVTSDFCPSDTAFLTVGLVGPPCSTGVEEIAGNITRYEIMPNPAHGEVTVSVELAHATQGHKLELLDVSGRVLRSEGITFSGTVARHTMDLDGVASGAYLLRLSSREGSAVQRLMVR